MAVDEAFDWVTDLLETMNVKNLQVVGDTWKIQYEVEYQTGGEDEFDEIMDLDGTAAVVDQAFKPTVTVSAEFFNLEGDENEETRVIEFTPTQGDKSLYDGHIRDVFAALRKDRA